jgi:polyribonucleotide nucleotidyltransferase
MLNAILFAHEEIKKIVSFIADMEAQIGKQKIEPLIYHPDEAIEAKVRAYAFDKVVWSLDTFDRHEREVRGEQVKAETVEAFKEEYPIPQRTSAQFSIPSPKKSFAIRSSIKITSGRARAG